MTTFSLEKALAGHPLITRDGQRALSFRPRDRNPEYPYLAEVGVGTHSFTPSGRCNTSGRDSNFDLFLLLEEETPPSPRFKVGDLVRHRASGTRGVVVLVVVRVDESPRYDVSTEFGAGTAVPEIVLERLSPYSEPTYGPSKLLQRILNDRTSSDL